MTMHYVNEKNMYLMHAKVLDGLEGNGTHPSERIVKGESNSSHQLHF
jgi:hypothetical protein